MREGYCSCTWAEPEEGTTELSSRTKRCIMHTLLEEDRVWSEEAQTPRQNNVHNFWHVPTSVEHPDPMSTILFAPFFRERRCRLGSPSGEEAPCDTSSAVDATIPELLSSGGCADKAGVGEVPMGSILSHRSKYGWRCSHHNNSVSGACQSHACLAQYW